MSTFDAPPPPLGLANLAKQLQAPFNLVLDAFQVKIACTGCELL